MYFSGLNKLHCIIQIVQTISNRVFLNLSIKFYFIINIECILYFLDVKYVFFLILPPPFLFNF